MKRNIPSQTSLTVLRERERTRGRGIGEPRLRRIGQTPPERQEFGRTYHKPSAPTQPVEIVIPPRPTRSATPHHRVIQTSDRFALSVDFPIPIAPADIRWQIEGDVLEIEYVGRDCTYYHNFLVPAGWPHSVSYQAQSFCIEFKEPPETCFPQAPAVEPSGVPTGNTDFFSTD